MSRTLWPMLAAVFLTACAQPTPEQQIVDDAAAALGGRDRILAVKTLVIEGEGINGNLGQDMTPEATGQSFTLTGYKRSMDVAGGRARDRADAHAELRLLPGPGAAEAGAGHRRRRRRTTSRRTAPRRARRMRSRAIGARSSTTTRSRSFARRSIRRPSSPTRARSRTRASSKSRPPSGQTFTLAIDSTTKLPTRVVSMTDNPNLGDVAIETSFADYQDVGGLKLPARLTTKTDTFTTVDIRADEADRRCRRRRSRGACRGRIGRADHRTAAGERHRPGSGQGHLVPRRPVAPQRARGVQRSPDAHRGAAERHANAGGDREGARAASRTSR